MIKDVIVISREPEKAILLIQNRRYYVCCAKAVLDHFEGMLKYNCWVALNFLKNKTKLIKEVIQCSQ